MSAFILRWLVTTVAVYVATKLVPGIHCSSVGTLAGASLLLGIINAFVNALLLLFVSQMLPAFRVDGFWSAFFGAIIISLTSWILSLFFRSSDGRVHTITHHPSIKKAKARLVQ